jgi:purine-cytosine permease-like protein
MSTTVTIIGINAIIAYITYTSLKCEIAAFYLIIMILPGKSPEAGQVPGALPPDDHPNAASDICGRFMIKKS